MKEGFWEKVLSRLDHIEPEERRRIFSRLLREQEQLKQVYEALQEGLVMMDGEGRIGFINRAAAGMFGVTPEVVVGKRLAEVVRGLDLEGLTGGTNGVMSRDWELFYPEHRFVNLYFAPLGDDEENYSVLLVRDTTRTREEAEALLESEKLNALTLLAAGVAHEIGNPLNSISLHLQIMERKLRNLPKGDRDQLGEHLQTARNEVGRLDTIMRQFLEAIRPTVPDRKPEDLTQLLRETLNLLGPELESRGVAVELGLEEGLPPLEVDEGQVRQAFFNVIRNAAQALPAEGGRIAIRTKVTDYEVVVEVIDEGSGMSPEVVGALFEPFRTTKKSGTGLGLLIVRRILREHGGEIEVESDEGRGTTVRMFFPRGEKQVRLLEGGAVEV